MFSKPEQNPLERVPNRFFGIRDLTFLKVGIWDFSEKERRYSGLYLGTGRGIWRFYEAGCGKCYSKETRSGKSGVENVQWTSSRHHPGREKKFTGPMSLQIKFLQCSLRPCKLEPISLNKCHRASVHNGIKELLQTAPNDKKTYIR